MPGRMLCQAQQVHPTRRVLDADEDVDPFQRDRVDVQEVHRQDGLGLCSEELLPGRADTAWRRIQSRLDQNVADGPRRDTMSETIEFSGDALIPCTVPELPNRFVSCGFVFWFRLLGGIR